jgi:uncharacterized protein (TIGR03067 family)
MKRLVAAVAAALVVVGAGSARQDTAPARSIDGTYKVLSATFGGKADTEKAAKATFEFKDGTVTIDHGGKKEDTAKFKLDPSKTPGHIDIFPERPDGKAETVMGIYQTKTTPEGFQLTIAFTKDSGDRPTDFKGDGPTAVVIKLLRQGDKK